MSAITVDNPVERSREVPSQRKRWRWCLIGAGALVFAGIMAYVLYLALNWPFTEQAVINALQQASLRTVTIDHFHKTFFPFGCVAEGVRFERHHHKEKAPIIEIPQLTIQGSYVGLLTAQYKIRLVKVMQMHITVPPARVNGVPDPLMPLNSTKSVHSLQIDKIIADGAVVDFAHEDGSQPYRITVEKLAVHGIKSNSVISYRAVIKNTLPSGEITSAGVFGPWDTKTPGNTALHGTYSYRDADLAAFQDLRGTMQAEGTFSGKLQEIRTAGTVDVSRFQVTGSGHERELKAEFQARVDGMKGNTFLDRVHSSFDQTVISAKGSIAGREGQNGKSVVLDLVCEKGRIEDVLDLFIKARPPVMGALQMQAHLTVPPGGAPFLKRMHMWGDFGISKEHFTDSSTQSNVNRLTQSAAKAITGTTDNEATSLANLKGHGDIRNAVANLTNLSFEVPGATAAMDGTYNLIDYRVHLRGRLYTDGKPADATSGFKSWILRAVTPFLKKKGNTRIVPFTITGDYHKTNVGLDLSSKK